MDLPFRPAHSSASTLKSFVSCVLAASVNSPSHSHVIDLLSSGFRNQVAWTKSTLKWSKIVEDKQGVVILGFD